MQGECDVVLELMRKLVDENAHTALDKEDYGRRYNAYAERFEKAKKKLEKINEQKANQQAKGENIEAFMKTLKRNDHLLTELMKNCGAQQSTDLLLTQQIMLPLYLRMVQNCLGIYE